MRDSLLIINLYQSYCLRCSITKVEHARDPVVVIPLQIDVFLDTHDARIRERCF